MTSNYYLLYIRIFFFLTIKNFVDKIELLHPSVHKFTIEFENHKSKAFDLNLEFYLNY